MNGILRCLDRTRLVHAYLKEVFVCFMLLLIQNRDAATETQSVEEVPDYGGDAKKGRPENNVPPSVQVNPLFRIMRTGAQVLLEDMKSSDNGEPQQPNASRPPPFPYRGIAA